MSEEQQAWSAATFEGTYADSRTQLTAFNAYKGALKRSWVRERTDLAALLGNIQTKLRTYHLRAWVPAEGLTQADVDMAWTTLAAAEAARSRLINAELRRAKEALRVRFADLANSFEESLRALADAVAALRGDLEGQKKKVSGIQAQLGPLAERLKEIEMTEKECEEANVEENDHTVFTRDDLQFELELVTTSVAKKLAFIDNQVSWTSMADGLYSVC